jgi:hypothetical protein
MDAAATELDQGKAGTKPVRLRRFLLAFLAPCLIAALLAGFSVAVLYSNNEHIGPVEAARIQYESGGLYSSALVYRPYPYKLELYRMNEPDVAVVGSSRALPFLPTGFAASEISLGGAVNEIADGERLIPEMLAAHKPKLVIFTLDYWWFNQARVADPTEVSSSAEVSFSLDELIMPYRWIADGDVSLGGLLKTLFTRPEGPPRLGMWANQNNSGFDDHGARHYGKILTGEIKNPDRKFKTTLRRVTKAKQDSKTAIDATFSETGWASLQHIDTMLRSAGVEVRYVMPPFPVAVLKELRSAGRPDLITNLHERLAQSGYAFYDFTDVTPLGATDCEFVDGFHGGFVAYLRMLRAMAPDLENVPALKGLIRPVGELDRLVAENAGRATLRDEAWSGRESDFLELGCEK